METYAFDELTGRAKSAAFGRYGEEEAVEEIAVSMMGEHHGFEELEAAGKIFNRLGWRFTEHGERVA